MKKLFCVISVFLAFLWAFPDLGHSAASTTVSRQIRTIIDQSNYARTGKDVVIKTVTITCTAASNGAITSATVASDGLLKWIPYMAEVIPGATGPTEGWAFTLKNANGNNIVSLSGLPNAKAGNEFYNLAIPGKGYVPVSGDMTFAATGNSVDSATFTIIITFYPE